MLFDQPIRCRWCQTARGWVYVASRLEGDWAILFCPRCDWAGGDHGPPAELVQGIRDWNQGP